MPEKPRTLFMERTDVSAERTASEISSMLAKSSARELTTKFNPSGTPIALSFSLEAGGTLVAFALPVRVEPVFKILRSRFKGPLAKPAEAQLREKAQRVAWRQLYRWIQAQLAMIDTGMVKSEEVFLPYLVHGASGQTLFEYFQKDGLKQLTAAEGTHGK